MHCLLQLSSGNSRSTKVPTFQMQVNGAGNGMRELRYGCHTVPIYQMPAMDAYCYSTVGTWLHCKGNCKCIRAGIRCGPLCKWEGGCINNDMAIWSVLFLGHHIHICWIIFVHLFNTFNQVEFLIFDFLNVKVLITCMC